MDKFQEHNAQKWCERNGWTNMFSQDGQFYAFPPNAVIPQPISKEVQPKNDASPLVIVDITNGNKRVLLFFLGLIVASSFVRPIVAHQLTSLWLLPSSTIKTTLSFVCFYGKGLITIPMLLVMGNSAFLLRTGQTLRINMILVLPVIVGALTAEFCNWMEVIFRIKHM